MKRPLGLAYEGLNEVDKAVDAYQKAIAFGEKSGKPSEQPMINLALGSHTGPIWMAL